MIDDERVNIRTCNEGEHQGMIVSFYFLFYNMIAVLLNYDIYNYYNTADRNVFMYGNNSQYI